MFGDNLQCELPYSCVFNRIESTTTEKGDISKKL